jgi:hypothetical protein
MRFWSRGGAVVGIVEERGINRGAGTPECAGGGVLIENFLLA